MIVSNENFIGNPANFTTNFWGSDKEHVYLENLSKQPNDWYYRTTGISYVYNSLGHRCKNIEDIDLDNYLLFTGCSHTEGIGLELEKTFPYIVSQSLGLDYYNLAIGGSGSDIMTHNLITWLSTVKKLPKALIVMWPQKARFCLNQNNSWSVFNATSSEDQTILEFMALGDQIGYFDTMQLLNEKLINTCYSDTKIIKLDSAYDIEYVDHARDLAHPGILANKNIANRILNQFN